MSVTTVEERWIDTKKLSEKLGIPIRTLQRWAEEGKIPSRQIKKGYKRRYQFSSVVEAIEANDLLNEVKES